MLWRERAPLGRKSRRAPRPQGWSMMRRRASGPLLPRCCGRHRWHHGQPQPGWREELERGQTRQPGPQPQPGERTARTDTPHQQCSSYDIRPEIKENREGGGRLYIRPKFYCLISERAAKSMAWFAQSSSSDVQTHTCTHTQTHGTVKNENTPLLSWIKRVDDLAVETCTVGPALPFPADTWPRAHAQTSKHIHRHTHVHRHTQTVAC